MTSITTLTTVIDFLNNPHKGRVIDENLKIVEKKGFQWCVLGLLQPFFACCFGIDLYRHVRVAQVAQSILLFCQKHKAQLSSEAPWIFQVIRDEVLDSLDRKTHQKYADQLQGMKDLLMTLAPQVPENYLARSWPQDLNTIGLTLEQKNGIDTAFNTLHAQISTNPYQYKIQFVKNDTGRTLQLLDQRFGSTATSIPISLSARVVYPETSSLVHSIVLSTKHLLGKGGQTRVRLYYNLLNGEQLAKKKSENCFQTALIEALHSKLSKGLVPIVQLHKKSETLYFFEPRYECTLTSLLEQNLCASFTTKISLMRDLLSGLAALHSYTTHEFSVSISGETRIFYQLKCFHVDLKPDNVLVKRVDGVWQAVIADFGSVTPLYLGVTFGFRSPETVQFIQNSPIQDADDYKLNVINFKLKNGQPLDIWQLGLLFSIILAGRFQSNLNSGYNVIFSPLEFLEKPITQATKLPYGQAGNPPSLEDLPASLPQEAVITSVQKLSDETSGKFSHFWELVNKMLQVDPSQRPSAAQLYVDFDAP